MDSMIKAAVFDFDMTLVAALEAAKKVIKDMEENEGISYSQFSFADIAGMSHEVFMQKLSDANDNKLAPEEISKMSKSYMRKHYADLRLEGIEFLKELQDMKINLGIISHNSVSVIEKVLENEYNKIIRFDCIYGVENMLGDGSKSETMKGCLTNFKITPAEFMYIGDHPNDIIAANDAGVMSAGVATGLHTHADLIKYKPDVAVNTLDELRDYVFDKNLL